ncbi:MAG: trypsin-like peptidase domain-containing protein [Erysipelotrichaceae bacterium]|nr:trypsin-like peptidase domain-containing protein [Erysipelotrichaceae bacterium]
MSQNKQTPPAFNKNNQNHSSRRLLILGLCVVLLSGLFGFLGSVIGNRIFSNQGSNGIQINQTTGSVNNNSNINDLSDVVSKCGPSVVEIITEQVSSGNSIFGQYRAYGAGSGVIISDDGYIVTNHHVIADATTIQVTTTDGEVYNAKLIGTDQYNDLAVIKIDAKGLTKATFGDSDSLEVGDVAIAIGNPLGQLGGSVSSGIISALDRQITIGNQQMTLLQTDAAINPGNSGGGLFDANGNLVGIVNAKGSSNSYSSEEGSVEGLGFAIPINHAVDIINDLMSGKQPEERAALNVSLYDYKNNSDYYLSEDMEEGVYIMQIVENGAADKAGLQVRDRILSVDGKDIQSSNDVKSIVQSHKVGDTIEVVVKRNNETVSAKVTLQAATTE